MPSTCANCGVDLPKENARYCNKCGSPVLSRTPNDAQQWQFDAGSFAAPRAELASALREMASSPIAPGTGTHLSEVEQGEMARSSLQHWMQPRRNERIAPVARKLRIRLWEEGDGQLTSTLTEKPALRESLANHAPVFPEESSPPSTGTQVFHSGGEQEFSSYLGQAGYREHIEQYDTMQLPASLPNTSLPAPLHAGSNGAAGHSQFVAAPDRRQLDESVTGHNAQFALAASLAPSPFAMLEPDTVQYAPEQARQAEVATQLLPAQPTAARISLSKKRRGLRWLAIGLVIVLLAFGGIGAWVMIAQPFNVPAVTQPQQRFSNQQLGVSLLYPSGWNYTLNQNGTSVTFNDSSHVAQMMLNIVAASNDDPGQYVQQQASKLGMTAVKTQASATFGGTSWQVVQGNVLQKGATYTEALLATRYGGKLYTLVFAAPQATYASEDHYIFSTMRSSLHFLS